MKSYYDFYFQLVEKGLVDKSNFKFDCVVFHDVDLLPQGKFFRSFF